MDSELRARDVLLAASVFEKLLGELSAFAMSDHPSDGVSAENIEYDIKVEVGPLGWPKELGDVPTPELVGTCGKKLMLGVSGMGELIAALTGLAGSGEQTVHGARRAMVMTFVE